ncbi:glucomannan 4-beta-mannosyltransferase 9-like [Fagus crenata]
MDRLSTTTILPDTFKGTRDDITGQIGLVWQQTKVPLMVSLLKLLVVVCLGMSLMLFMERVYMGIVIVFVKLFGRKPEKSYKCEPIRVDLELWSFGLPHGSSANSYVQ